jgi:AcrR family transcriptional regulator
VVGRTRSFDRDEALEIAARAFWRDGFERTTIAGLTEAMGISAPSMYAAFGDKEQLFAEAAALYSRRNVAELEVTLCLPTAHESISAFLRTSAALHTDPQTPPGSFELSEPLLDAERAILRELVEARVARGIAEGDVAEDVDPATVGAFVVAVAGGMSTRARDGGSAAEVLAIAEFALRAI